MQQFATGDELRLRALIQAELENLDVAVQDERYRVMSDEVYTSIDLQINQLPATGGNKIKRLWPSIAAAASIVFAVGLGGYVYFNQEKETITHESSYANDVAPGREGATLTLANGKKIRLSDATNGELAKEAGVTISKSADGQLRYEIKEDSRDISKINTLSTAKGETYQVRLPDGSLVWLNAASSLTYSANLVERGKRRVRLDGEGYFEVAKDKAHPFVVESRGQEVEVLGTHFNVNAYNDEDKIKTTLFEGSVKVFHTNNEILLKPGEQATLSENKLSVSEADTEEVLAWKDGDFIFNREPIESVMRKLERWYDIEVIYRGEVPTDGFQGAISKFKNISQVLKLLEQTKVASFKIEGRRVIVKKYTK